jgi:acyl-CoA reductase-like NAD-dependent aldehyde dehydrogenase
VRIPVRVDDHQEKLNKEAAMAAKQHKMFIGGNWVDAVNGKTFEDMNPFTREVYAYMPAGRCEDARRAIEAAQSAFPEWSATPPSMRRNIFLKAADIMDRRQNELVKAMMEEVGGTIGCDVPDVLRARPLPYGGLRSL